MKKASWIFWTGLSAAVLALCAGPVRADEALLADLAGMKSVASAEAGEAKLAALLEEGLRSYEGLRDYRAIFEKTELSKGTLGPTEKIYLKFEKPWKIYMGWLNTPKKGLQIVYERGKHDGKLAIHKPGLFLGFAPVIFLEQSSPWVREGSEAYNIEDAGIGTFLFDFTKAVIRGARENRLKVEFREKKADITFIDSKKDKDYFAYRVTVLFDEENHLPVWMELFDWENRTTGIYAYEDLKINVGIDEDFKRQINRHLFKIYSPQTDRAKTKPQNFARR
ncbi:MAG: DUF1571 domain-containing protein [Candidatus Omnitrophota bacterium]